MVRRKWDRKKDRDTDTQSRAGYVTHMAQCKVEVKGLGWGSQSPSHRPTTPLATPTSGCSLTWSKGGWEDERTMVPMRPRQKGLHFAVPQDSMGCMLDANFSWASVQASTEGEGGYVMRMQTGGELRLRTHLRQRGRQQEVGYLGSEAIDSACTLLSSGHNTSSKAKLLRISRQRLQSFKSQVWALLKVGLVWMCWSQAPKADIDSKAKNSVENGKNNFLGTNQLEQMDGPTRKHEKSKRQIEY